MGWDGMGRDGTGWDGMGCHGRVGGVGWGGVGRAGAGWDSGVGWSGAGRGRMDATLISSRQSVCIPPPLLYLIRS